MNLEKRNLSAASAVGPAVESKSLPDWTQAAIVGFLLILAYLTAHAIQGHHFLWLPALAVALIFCGFRKPYELLTVALVLAPLDLGLTGDMYNHIPVIFSISDVLLLTALPGTLFRLRRLKTRGAAFWKLDGLGLPMLCYLLAGFLSFAVNIPNMHGHSLGYFSGWLRNAQSVLIAPLLYASLDWNWGQLRGALRGYLLCALFIADWGFAAFCGGMRDGLYILGIHKNMLGLALTLAALIALVAWLPTARQKRAAERGSLLGLPAPLLALLFAFYLLTLVCSLSRGSLLSLAGGFVFVCALWRRPALLAALLLLTAAVFVGVRAILPPEQRQYTTDFSQNSTSVYDRIGMLRVSAARFRAQPLLGDGFRIRRDITPHNMEAMVLAENGSIGFVFLVWGMAAYFRMLRRSYQALADDPRLQSFVAIIAVCAIALLIHGQVEPYWRRGPLLLPWAGAGIIWSLVLQKGRESRRAGESGRY